ncbi:hypothetical protein CNECB9_1950034 [Cupriavidus necator]|uniref:Uncharacterized protein n=1 Tax=Cupriavidus necator TaxID=106590 RepID=A0A1K0IPC1_CUPNE|nr:hypothetical protein CNECB9_1950034 [Cupriavidus necator]
MGAIAQRSWLAKSESNQTVRHNPFDLPHDVLVVVLSSLAIILCMLGLFAWYLQRRRGPGRRTRDQHGTVSRKRTRKSRRRRK